MSLASDQLRKAFGEGDTLRDAGLTTPQDIVRYDDIVYGSDPNWQVLDVYRPRAVEGQKLPVIVSVHGGGWVYGDKERYQFYCMNLAQRGFAVVNYTYRLAPEFKFPASLEDAVLVFSWVLDNAEKYGMDKEHIFAVGDSAGGHSLGLFAGLCTDPEFAGQFDFQPPRGFAPKAIALNCGCYRIIADNDLALMADLLPNQGTKEELELIDVTRHITENYPPTFFMTCTGDFLRVQAQLLEEKLAACSVPFVYRFYGDARHELGHVFHCNIKSGDAKLCNDEECDFFKRFC